MDNFIKSLLNFTKTSQISHPYPFCHRYIIISSSSMLLLNNFISIFISSHLCDADCQCLCPVLSSRSHVQPCHTITKLITSNYLLKKPNVIDYSVHAEMVQVAEKLYSFVVNHHRMLH